MKEDGWKNNFIETLEKGKDRKGKREEKEGMGRKKKT